MWFYVFLMFKVFSGSLLTVILNLVSSVCLIWHHGLPHPDRIFSFPLSQYKAPAPTTLPFGFFHSLPGMLPRLTIILKQSCFQVSSTASWNHPQMSLHWFRRQGVLLCLVSSPSVIKHKQNPHELLLLGILLKVCSTHCSFHFRAISELVNHRHISSQPQKGGRQKARIGPSIFSMPSSYQKSIISIPTLQTKIPKCGKVSLKVRHIVNS